MHQKQPYFCGSCNTAQIGFIVLVPGSNRNQNVFPIHPAHPRHLQNPSPTSWAGRDQLGNIFILPRHLEVGLCQNCKKLFGGGGSTHQNVSPSSPDSHHCPMAPQDCDASCKALVEASISLFSITGSNKVIRKRKNLETFHEKQIILCIIVPELNKIQFKQDTVLIVTIPWTLTIPR